MPAFRRDARNIVPCNNSRLRAEWKCQSIWLAVAKYTKGRSGGGVISSCMNKCLPAMGRCSRQKPLANRSGRMGIARGVHPAPERCDSPIVAARFQPGSWWPAPRSLWWEERKGKTPRERPTRVSHSCIPIFRALPCAGHVFPSTLDTLHGRS